MKKKRYSLFKFNKDQIINPLDKNGFDKVAQYWQENKSVVPITTVIPLIDNDEFVDLIASLRLKFISEKEPELSQKICSLIHKVSAKKYGNSKIGENRTKEADKMAKQIGPLFDSMDDMGIKSIRAKTEELNSFNIPSPRGEKWHPTSVRNTYIRWKKLKAEEEVKNTPSTDKTKTPKP